MKKLKILNDALPEDDAGEGMCEKCGKPFWREEQSEFGRIDIVQYGTSERPGYCVDCVGR